MPKSPARRPRGPSRPHPTREEVPTKGKRHADGSIPVSSSPQAKRQRRGNLTARTARNEPGKVPPKSGCYILKRTHHTSSASFLATRNKEALSSPLPEPTPLVAPQLHLSKSSTRSNSDLPGKNEVLKNNTPGGHPYSPMQPHSPRNTCSCLHHVMAKRKAKPSRISPGGTQYYHVPPCPSSTCSDSDLAARNAEVESDPADSGPYFPIRPNPVSPTTRSDSCLSARTTIVESGSAATFPLIPIRQNPSTLSTCSDSGLAARNAELESDSPEGGRYLPFLPNPSTPSTASDSDISANTIAPNPDPPQSNHLVTIQPTLGENDPGLNYSVSSLEPASSDNNSDSDDEYEQIGQIMLGIGFAPLTIKSLASHNSYTQPTARVSRPAGRPVDAEQDVRWKRNRQ
jgi:hypothetical protein